MTINQIQDEIINEFSLLDGDMEMTVFYIMELGQKLPTMPEEDKTEDNIVKGASGQAVQSMNIMCGFPETAGLI